MPRMNTLAIFKSITGTEQFRELMHVYEVRPRKDHRGVDLISAS
jgi:hypothetical protein